MEQGQGAAGLAAIGTLARRGRSTESSKTTPELALQSTEYASVFTGSACSYTVTMANIIPDTCRSKYIYGQAAHTDNSSRSVLGNADKLILKITSR